MATDRFFCSIAVSPRAGRRGRVGGGGGVMVDEGAYRGATGGSRGKRVSLRLSRRLSCEGGGEAGEEVECEGEREWEWVRG